MSNKLFRITLLMLIFCREAVAEGPSMNPPDETRGDAYTEPRENMVHWQLEERGIQNPAVLQAMRKVERHLFVPFQNIPFAYGDFPLEIEYGQTISQPYIVAFMTEALALKPRDRVLEIGTGSGYQAAILAEIVEEVYTIEIIPELAGQADQRLKDLGYTNITVKAGDGYEGWVEAAPFDAILVTAAPPDIPQKLVDQLHPSGGRMILPVGARYQNLLLITKEGDKIQKKNLLPVIFVPMVHGHAQ